MSVEYFVLILLSVEYLGGQSSRDVDSQQFSSNVVNVVMTLYVMNDSRCCTSAVTVTVTVMTESV